MKESKTKKAMSKLDILKWVIAISLLLGGIAANYFYAAQPLGLRLIGWLLLLCVMAAILIQTAKGRQGLAFAKEARNELRKVVWPNRQETVRTTAVVLAMVVLVGFALWGIDSILLLIVGFLTGQRG